MAFPANYTLTRGAGEILYVLRADAVVSTNGTQINRTGIDMNRRVCDVRLVSYEPGMLQSYVFENLFSQGKKMSKISYSNKQESKSMTVGAIQSCHRVIVF